MGGVCYLALFAGSVTSGWLGSFYEVMTPRGFWLMHAAVVAAGAMLIVLLRSPLTRALDAGASATTPVTTPMEINA
jgi:proton-dependent oligopeptide transporter, POT family